MLISFVNIELVIVIAPYDKALCQSLLYEPVTNADVNCNLPGAQRHKTVLFLFLLSSGIKMLEENEDLFP